MSNTERIARGGLAFLIAASVASSIGGLPFNTMPILLGAFADSLQLGPAELGRLGSACLGGYLVSTLLGPLWVDRAPWRPAAIFGALATAATALWSASTDGVPYLPFAAFGFAAGLMHSLGMRMVNEAADKERAFGIRLFTELVLIASLLFFLPAALAAAGLMGGAQLLAVAAVVMGLSALVLPRGPVTDADTAQTAQTAASAGGAGSAGWIALGIFVLFACGQVALWVFLERIAQDVGADAAQMGLLFAVLKVVGGLSAALVAALGDKLGNRLPHLLVFLALCVGVALLAVRPSFMVFAFGAWIWEAAFTIGCVFQTAAIAKLDTSNKLVVLVPAAFAISAFVGPVLGGMLAATGFAPLLALAVACAAIPMIAYWLFAGRMGGAPGRTAA